MNIPIGSPIEGGFFSGTIFTGTSPMNAPIQIHSQPTARDYQVGGTHYRDMAIQPFEYIYANSIGFAEGCIIKYVSRWRSKNGIEDLRKARHFLDLLIEAEERSQ